MNHVHVVALLAVAQFLAFGVPVGRFVCRHKYIADPASRHAGFLLPVIPAVTLFVLGLVGAIVRH